MVSARPATPNRETAAKGEKGEKILEPEGPMIQQISKVVGLQIIRYCYHVSDTTLARQADRVVTVSNACTLCHRSSPETIEMDADLLRQEVKLVGGSCAGIFVDDLGKATDSNLNVGDKIIKVCLH